MSQLIQGLLGGGSGGTDAATAAVEKQREEQEAERNRLEQQADASRRVAGVGGLRGLLQFVDDRQLAKKLGG